MAALLDRVNLTGDSSRQVGGFSGGMKQRPGIAQALIGRQKLLVVDEPTAGLDPEERVRFHNLLADIADDDVVVLATAALSLLTQTVLMAAARLDIRFSGTAIEIGSSAATLLVLALYLFGALSRVVARPWAATAVATLALTAWMVIVLSAYRFVLFLATFAAT